MLKPADTALVDKVLKTVGDTGSPLGLYLSFIMSMSGDQATADSLYDLIGQQLGRAPSPGRPSPKETVENRAAEMFGEALARVTPPVDADPRVASEKFRKAVLGALLTFDWTEDFLPAGMKAALPGIVNDTTVAGRSIVARSIFRDNDVGLRAFAGFLAVVPFLYGFTVEGYGDAPEGLKGLAEGLAGVSGAKPYEILNRIRQYSFLTQEGGTVPPSLDGEHLADVCNKIASADRKAVAGALMATGSPWDFPRESLTALVPAVENALSVPPAPAGETPAEPEEPRETGDTLNPEPVEGPEADIPREDEPSVPEPEKTPEPTPAERAAGVDPETIGTLDYRTVDLLRNMSYDEDQLKEAVDTLEEMDSSSFPFLPYFTSYHPGLTEKAVTKLLDNYTSRASHKNFTLKKGEPGDRRTVMIPPAFKVDPSPSLWTRAVITGMGFPFINFTCPSVAELLRGSDPDNVRRAYRNVKAMFKQCGLKKPIDTLKEFARAQYRNCALAALTVDASELYDAEPGSSVSASVIDPYSKTAKVKGTAPMSLDFLTTFYTVLSPVTAVRQYSEICDMEPKDYMSYLSHNGKPPVYILNPKRVQFRRGPRGGLFHRLFSSKTAPVLVRTRVNGHDGGLLVPEKLADLLFVE